MKCINPITIKNKCSKPDAPLYLTVPCGKCYYCLQNKRASRVIRLTNEYLNRPTTFFLTLTINDESLPQIKDNPKREIQLFLKRLRKRSSSKLSYFICSELGSHTHRLHFHALIYYHQNITYDESYENILNSWPYGNIQQDYCNDARINYVTKYMLKQINGTNFCLMSKKPALGSFLLSNSQQRNFLQTNNYIPLNGYKYPIPRYYNQKLNPDKYLTIHDKYEQDVNTILQNANEQPIINQYLKENNLTDYDLYKLKLQQLEKLKQIKFDDQNKKELL